VANTAKIAYWNGTAWNALGTGIGGTVTVINCIGFGPDGNLYIGGDFTGVDGSGNGDYICYWDGTSFNRIGTTELNADVNDIGFDNNGHLIITGEFTNAGGNANADYIALWFGSGWRNFSTGLNGEGYTLYVGDNNDVYVAGNFSSAGGLNLTDRSAHYVSGSWRMLDIDLPSSGIPSAILIDSQGNLYLGGGFTTTLYGNAVTSKVAANIEYYSGSANGYPFIQIHGPGVLQTIVNWSSKKAIQFNGLTLQAGEYVSFYLDPHNVKVVSNWRGNCLKYIIPGSDIANFYLTPSNVFKNGQAGQNNIGVLMPSGTTSNSAGWLDWRPKYWSIEGAKYE
jgi:hypothetical protein